MYAGCVACCPLVSHGEYANETDRKIEGWMDESRTVTLCLPLAAASVIKADKRIKSRLVRLPAWKQIRPIIIQRRLSWEKPDGKSDWPLLLLRRWREPTAIVSDFNNNNHNEVNKQPHIRMITSYSQWPCITVMCRTIEMTLDRHHNWDFIMQFCHIRLLHNNSTFTVCSCAYWNT